LRDVVVRRRVMLVLAAAYAAAILILTGQALSGQPVTAPSGTVLVAGLAVAVATPVACGALVAGARR